VSAVELGHDPGRDAAPDPTPPEVFLSVVAPVHNGAGFIRANVQSMIQTFERMDKSFELIVVCDGCTDGTEPIVESIDDERVRAVCYPDQAGKGHAITEGLAQARGRLVGWLDSDLDVDAEVILDAARVFAERPVDAVIGSKRHPASAVGYPLLRRVYSWGYQLLIRLLFRFNTRDTQVGAKLFRREMIETVRPLLLIKRYAFDLEVLAVGAEFGFDRVEEVPIRLEYRFSGTGINWQAVYHMLVDTLAIAYRIHVLHWYVRRFAAVQRRRVDDVQAGAEETG